MQAFGPRHVLNHDYERYKGSPKPVRWWDVSFFGLLKRGKVRSSRESGQYFADLNNVIHPPETKEIQLTNGVQVRQILWREDPKPEVELIAVFGGGHVIPQPYWRAPRLLGPTPKEPNGPAVIWDFFERQQPR